MIKKDFVTLLDFYSEEDFDNILNSDESLKSIQKNTCYDIDVILTSITEDKESIYPDRIAFKNNNVHATGDLNSHCSNSDNHISINNSNECKANHMKIDVLSNDNSNYKDSNILRNELRKCESLRELRLLIDEMDICAIKKIAKNTVFSDGNQSAKYMLIGEAPGEQEDTSGIPFCGKSGKLLRSMLREAGFHDDELYFSNILFWRPPANRTPTYEEINACMPFVEKHIQLLNPEMIILVGNTAASSLLHSKLGITMLRKKIHEYKNDFLDFSIKSVAIFHPSYILRNITKRVDTVEELVLIRALCEQK